MQNKNLENQIDFLLATALQKCGNSYDAEDLTQEVLLAALSYLSRGNFIQNMRAFLLTVMNRKFNDMLRKKYRQPTIFIGCDFDLADERENGDTLEKAEEAYSVRRAVAHLATTYREIIVRYYMDGEGIAEIAAALSLPEGTVKSRLYLGRERIRKGMEYMEKYGKQSYSPVMLSISNSGMPGRGGEPMSLVNRDLTIQNILWLAYKKPLTIEEISQAIGIPTAYIEPDIKTLVDGELMRQTGTRYYTDFMISTIEEKEKYIPAQKELVHQHFDLFFGAIRKGLQQLRKTDFYQAGSFDAKNSLELYFVFHCLDYGIYKTFCDIFNTAQNFPDRPDGGAWIAFGTVSFSKFHPQEHTDLIAHSYAGERHEYFNHFAGCKRAALHTYSAEGFSSHSYDRMAEYPFLLANEDFDAVLTKLLCLLCTGANPESVGFNTEYLKAIPWLIKCKILLETNGKPKINIPLLNTAQADNLWELCGQVRTKLSKDIRSLLTGFFQGKKQEIPAHLDSVPLQKQYLYAQNALLIATVREAIKRGECNGNYNNENGGSPCPMVFICEIE
ncbi:MAG: sigma-70 family RNA polymerase sigma factor [Lachnospiraceae bacterium]|nr:sigma-70 family RNA polymerase sigma factor [Lachnospiraceae bacterium]